MTGCLAVRAGQIEYYTGLPHGRAGLTLETRSQNR